MKAASVEATQNQSIEAEGLIARSDERAAERISLPYDPQTCPM